MVVVTVGSDVKDSTSVDEKHISIMCDYDTIIPFPEYLYLLLKQPDRYLSVQ